MKQKQTFNFYKIIKISVVALVVLAMLNFGVTAAQDSAEEIKEDVSEKQEQLRQINDEIQNLQREITRKQNEIASLKNEIAIFDLQILQTERQVQAVELEISTLNDEILITQTEIEETEAEIQKQKEFLAETLRLIHEFDAFSPLEITFGNETFSEFLDQVEYADNLQERNQEVLEKVRALQAELQRQRAELDEQLADQEVARNQLALTLNSLEQQRGGKQALLNRTRGQESAYSELLGQASAKQEEVSREIFELELALRRQLGDPTLPPVTGEFRWPASGILTQGYGNTGFTALGYSFHNGIDIAGPPGTRIFATADGVVEAVGTGEAAYGNWIVIRHTIDQNGDLRDVFSLYAHLQGFNVVPGEPVTGGDLIGFMGNTGNTTRLLYGPERGYHLHFTIFDEKGFRINQGRFQDVYGPYQVPVGVTFNPMDFLN